MRIDEAKMTEGTARELIELLREHDARSAHSLRCDFGLERGSEMRCAPGVPDSSRPLPRKHSGRRLDPPAPRRPMPPEEGLLHGRLPVPHAHGGRVSLDEKALTAALACIGAEHVAAEVATDVPGEVKLIFALAFGIPASFRPAVDARHAPEGLRRAHSAGWGNPLLSPEALAHLACVLGADPVRIEAELAGAPQHMVALILALSGFAAGAPDGPSLKEGGFRPGDSFEDASDPEASEGPLAGTGIELGPLSPHARAATKPDAPAPEEA